jgi:hypothetical protein
VERKTERLIRGRLFLLRQRRIHLRDAHLRVMTVADGLTSSVTCSKQILWQEGGGNEKRGVVIMNNVGQLT